jgi:hypothetical protein
MREFALEILELDQNLEVSHVNEAQLWERLQHCLTALFRIAGDDDYCDAEKREGKRCVLGEPSGMCPFCIARSAVGKAP